MTRLQRAAIFLFCALAGCENQDTAVRQETAPTDTAAASQGDEPFWFRQARALDLTGDGVADSVVVEARGQRSDSLRLGISFVVGGRPLFVQDWHSSYELANLDSLSQRPPRSDQHMRTALANVLNGVRLAPLDTSYIRDFPGDTAALRMARRGPVQSISIAYGYETTIAVVWDPDAKRFLIAHACC